MAILTINRAEKFDITRVLGDTPKGSVSQHGHTYPSTWQTVKEWSGALTELDTSKLTHGRFVSEFDPGRWTMKQEEYVRRIETSGYMPMDAQTLMALLENQDLIPVEWREFGSIRFDGTLFRDEHGGERVLCLVFYINWFCTSYSSNIWKPHSVLLKKPHP